MLAVFSFQAVLMGGMRFVASVPLLVGVAFFVGLNYGANLTLFPATTFDFYGTKNAGADYGLVFTAWGVGGVMSALVVAWLSDQAWTLHATGGFSYAPALAIGAALSLVAAALTFVLRAPDPSGEHCPVVDAGAGRQA
jgi:OFA family oxalate/formate antiporter-like MFS transporter